MKALGYESLGFSGKPSKLGARIKVLDQKSPRLRNWKKMLYSGLSIKFDLSSDYVKNIM